MREKVSKNKELIKIWDYEKNQEEGLSPEILTCGSKKEVYWKCPKGHSYKQSISHKIRHPENCPVCSGHKTIKGVNDFATLNPEIFKEWNKDKNVGIDPHMLSKKSGKKVWWKCSKCNHEWQATIHDRVGDKTGCPRCSSRRSSSFPEQAVYYYVRKVFPDAINRYKDVFDNKMELDVYIPSIKTAIEFDGAYFHNTESSKKKELIKYEICKKNNIRLIRIKQENEDKTKNRFCETADITYYVDRRKNLQRLSSVIQVIIDDLDPESNYFTRKNFFQYYSKTRVDVERDQNEIKEYLTETSDNIRDKRPDLAKEWHPTKNGNLRPEMFGINSNDKAWWKCSVCGHEWQTTIIHRAGKRQSGCPICKLKERGKTYTKTKIEQNGSPAENNPKLAEEWHPYKNGELTPRDITAKCCKKIWWLCKKCGYEWEQSPNTRSRGIGCPCCAGRVPKQGVNDLKALKMPYLDEWDYEKNSIKPDECLPKSDKEVWWKCKKCGNSWKTAIKVRTMGSGCPICNHKKIKNK